MSWFFTHFFFKCRDYLFFLQYLCPSLSLPLWYGPSFCPTSLSLVKHDSLLRFIVAPPRRCCPPLLHLREDFRFIGIFGHVVDQIMFLIPVCSILPSDQRFSDVVNVAVQKGKGKSRHPILGHVSEKVHILEFTLQYFFFCPSSVHRRTIARIDRWYCSVPSDLR